MSRSVNVISVKDFTNSIDVLLVWQSFLFWNQLSYFKGHVYSSLIVEMKLEMLVFESILKNQVSLVKDPTHVIQYM